MFFDYLREVGGQSIIDRFHAFRGQGRYRMTPEERLEQRSVRPPHIDVKKMLSSKTYIKPRATGISRRVNALDVVQRISIN